MEFNIPFDNYVKKHRKTLTRVLNLTHGIEHYKLCIRDGNYIIQFFYEKCEFIEIDITLDKEWNGLVYAFLMKQR